jgi:hypothetical protein
MEARGIEGGVGFVYQHSFLGINRIVFNKMSVGKKPPTVTNVTLFLRLFSAECWLLLVECWWFFTNAYIYENKLFIYKKSECW